MRFASQLGGGIWWRGLLALGLAFGAFACTTMDGGHPANLPAAKAAPGPQSEATQDKDMDKDDDGPTHHILPQDGTHHLAH